MSGQATAAAAAPAAAPATATVPLSAGATTTGGGAQASRAVPGIKYRHVGKSGLVVSNLALGNVTVLVY